MFSEGVRLFHTVRYLRPVQILGRVWFKVYRPRVDLSPSPARRVPAEVRAARLPGQATLLRPWLFRFLNEEHALVAPQDWDDPAIAKLWRYNLHYFDDLKVRAAAQRAEWHQQLLLRWVRENPPARGTGWEPYPTSLRIVNWIKWALAGNSLPAPCLQSLAVQGRWLSRRLEVHLLGNHLLANAKALVFAGAFFYGHEADAWFNRGLAILQRQLAEQILTDGGHFERSPMYHAIVLEDVLDLIQLAAQYPGRLEAAIVEGWRSVARRMLSWLGSMTHPDGEIALFNDAAFDIAPNLAALKAYADGLEVSVPNQEHQAVVCLADSGYVRSHIGQAVLIADVGEIGPDYLPGHAHADSLSFELSLDGCRLLVDGGTSTYATSAERLRQRGTGSHNTVVVDGRDSSEVWDSFRVARRARPLAVHVRQSSNVVELEGGHDGYRRLPGRVTHRRRWRLDDAGLLVQDRLEGEPKTAEAFFNLAPDVAVVRLDPSHLILHGAIPEVRVQIVGGEASVERSEWHCRFGAPQPTARIRVRMVGNQLTTAFVWQRAV